MARERRAIQGVAPPGPQHRRARPASPARCRCTAPKPLVVVDPGHGGRDPGAVGVRGTPEKTVVLATARELRRALRATGRYRVALTREGDVFVPLRARLAFARRSRAALVVSLHADSVREARGTSVYTYSAPTSDPAPFRSVERQHAPGQQRRTKAVAAAHPARAVRPATLTGGETGAGSARLVVAEVGRFVPLLAAPHRKAGFAVLGALDIPPVLVEVGFLSHSGEEALLRRAAHQRRRAGALARAVDRWFLGADRPLVVDEVG